MTPENTSAPLPSLAQTIAQFGLQAKKSLGQHFLLDVHLCETIVALAGDLTGVHVIEIGAGPGGLTRALLTSDAASVTALEKDHRAIPALEQLASVSSGRLHLCAQDALMVNAYDLTPAPRAIIANLPYNIGTELVIGWLEDLYRDPHCYTQLLVMLQREVGERIAAPVGCKRYGRLSVLSQWLCEVELRLDIPKESFSPPPKVESVMVQLTPRAAPLVDVPKEALEKVVAVAFQQRRKMLRSALKPLGITGQLEALGIDETLRPEQLTIEQFAQLAKLIAQ